MLGAIGGHQNRCSSSEEQVDKRGKARAHREGKSRRQHRRGLEDEVSTKWKMGWGGYAGGSVQRLLYENMDSDAVHWTTGSQGRLLSGGSVTKTM